MSDELLNSAESDCSPCVDVEAAPLLESLLGYPELSEADAVSFQARHKDHLAACPFCGPQFEIASRRRPSPPPRFGEGAGGRGSSSPRYTWVHWVIAASLALTCIILGGAYAREQIEKRKLREKLTSVTEHERLLEAKREEQLASLPIQLAWEILRQPHQDRRQQVQKYIADAIKLRNALPPEVDRDHIDAEIRSVFAASLAFPTIRVAEGDVSDDLAKLEYWTFLAHPTAILPDAAGMAIATKTRPYFWRRGTKPEWIAKLTRDDFVAGEHSPRIDYSPDARYLAFAPQIEGGLTLWDRECTREMHTLVRADGPGSIVLAVGFNPDSKRLFAVRADGAIPSWILEDGKVRSDQAWPLAKRLSGIVAARFSSDNTWLAVADEKGFITPIAADGTALRPAKFERDSVALAWSPDNRTIAAALASGSIRVFEKNNSEIGYQSPAFNFAKAVCVQFSPNGQFLLAGARNQGGRIFNARTGEPLTQHDYGVSTFSKDGKWFSSSNGGRAAFVEFVPPKVVRQFGGLFADILRIAWSKDSRRVVTLDAGFVLRVLDVTKPNPIVAEFPVDPNDESIATMSDVALSDDGRQVFYARGGSKKTDAAVFDVESGKELPNSRWSLPGGSDRAAYVGRGQFLAVREEVEERADTTAKYKTVVRVFEVGKKQPISERVLRKSEATDVNGFTHQYLTPDGKYYAWSGPRAVRLPGTKRVEVLNVSSGERTRIPVDCSNPSLPSSILSPDGKYLWYDLTNDQSQSIKIADPRPATKESIVPFAIAPGPKFVARVGSRSKELRQLELARWPSARAWLHFANPDQSNTRGEGSAFSPDGQFLAFGSPSGMFTLVNLSELEKQIAEIEKDLPKVRP